MKPAHFVLAGSAGLFLLGLALVSRAGAGTPVAAPSRADLVERGRYLVNNVGMCIDCHSPRGRDGQFIAGRELTGSVLTFAPTVPMPWAEAAPGIAGLPAGYTEEATAHFLMTGERAHSTAPLRPPMPLYHMEEGDARAVAAYLASLAPADGAGI